jgi:hypothetical protein
MQCTDWAALARAGAVGLGAVALLSGCETMGTSFGKRIEYKTVTTAPALEIPPDLTSPQYDDRYAVATASALAAQNASRPKAGEQIASNTSGEARIARSGNERWLVVKTTPENAWSTTRQFWIDNGLVLAVEQPATGIMETDWAENRGDLPRDAIQRTLGKVGDFFVTTFRQDKFRTRIERGSEPGTVEIFISSRRMEQMPTGKIDNSSPSGFRGESARPCAARKRDRRASTRRRGQFRPRVETRRPRARPHRLHRRRSRSLEGTVLRPLRRSRRTEDNDERLDVEAHVLARQHAEARAVSDSGERVRRAERRSRSGPERRAREIAEQREDPRAAAGAAQMTSCASLPRTRESSVVAPNVTGSRPAPGRPVGVDRETG